VSPDTDVVVEVFGEGKTDVGHDPRPQRPTKAVVPILLHKLCGMPDRMLVKRHGVPFLQQPGIGKGLWQKVRFARQQAFYSKSDAAVFVVDSEGDLKGRAGELAKGRGSGPSDLPMAVGVAHPCIESWLLADAAAIRRGLGLSKTPNVPENPEELPAPAQDRSHNPKTELRQASGANQQELSAKDKDKIATAINDLDLLRSRCPRGFAPFADEVEQYIVPLFRPPFSPSLCPVPG